MKKQTLWIIIWGGILSMPFSGHSQAVEVKDGSLIIDLKPEKKKKETREFVSPDEDPTEHAVLQDQKKKLEREEEDVNLSKESLFKGIFSAGMNICQVDGDQEAGYKKVGAYVGVGTLVKFHKNFSVSLEMVYSMRGAKPHYNTLTTNARNQFDISYDYLDIPLSLNVHDKKFVMFGVGLSLGAMMRYKETSPFGNPAPDTLSLYTSYQTPRKFDLAFQTGFSFLIKRVIGVGVKFQYSLLSLRPSYGVSKIKGQYNNLFTFRLTYVLDPKLLKNQKRKR